MTIKRKNINNVAGRIMATKAVQAFFPINCESVTLHDKKDFASKIKVVNLEKGRLV